MTINLTPGSIKFIDVRSRADTPMDTINDHWSSSKQARRQNNLFCEYQYLTFMLLEYTIHPVYFLQFLCESEKFPCEI